ncbi:hypothetical protein NDI56_06470 [Haloarcula sp. S1CR25-12]|uniref:Halobacterial output domain-containing protein n=1 Tax=Haloarcula saliterrae TaxID=2950534 RepID=A0ABU2F9T0_9EURY|nr:hypothetical protein [Haloarcula sp. S1CR25-12]MDS0259033.1 hypothetical protein [Haloarcula sp. S1CR25-12]
MVPGGITDGGTTVDPTDREALRRHLEQFAGEDRVTESPDGTLVTEFSQSTYVSVDPEGHVEGGMPLHLFEGPAETIEFDHDSGEIYVSTDDEAASYTFRRPSR